MKNKLNIWLIAFGAIFIGFYPLTYFIIDIRFGLLQSKSSILLENTYWQIGFFTHILSGGAALLFGWPQLVEKWRIKHPNLHRNLGKIYVIMTIMGALSGLFIGFYATGGIIASIGFITLAIIWFLSTMKGFWAIRKGDIETHKKMMIYSYAACFAAVTLRIWLPLLILITREFTIAYQIVAWLCWLPNMIWAYNYNNKKVVLF